MTIPYIPVRRPQLRPGDCVRITQRIVGRDQTWSTAVEGVVESVGPEKTGSWFAHGKEDKLWLSRVRLRKKDGEITVVCLDQNSQIEKL